MVASGAPATVLARPLCVQCRRCGRKRVFGSLSAEARAPDPGGVRRLVCTGCGARDPKVQRLCDDREAARWLADR